MRIWYRLVTISLTSPKHTCSQSQETLISRDRKHDELRYVTARVSHRPQTLHSHVMSAARKDSAVHVSLSSDLIVKQRSLISNNTVRLESIAGLNSDRFSP